LGHCFGLLLDSVFFGYPLSFRDKKGGEEVITTLIGGVITLILLDVVID